MIKAVVFDMDGLLVDSEPLWQRARFEALGGAERLGWTQADQVAVMGTGTMEWARYLAAKLDHVYTTDEIIDRVLGQMEALYRQSVPTMPGAHEILAQLRGRYRLGLASGSWHRLLRAVLDSTGWRSLFDEIVSGEDMTRGKPAPDIYLHIMRKMGVAAEETVVFEDSLNGILAGLAAGAHVIAVPETSLNLPADVLAKTDRVLGSLLDFSLDMLDSM